MDPIVVIEPILAGLHASRAWMHSSSGDGSRTLFESIAQMLEFLQFPTKQLERTAFAEACVLSRR